MTADTVNSQVVDATVDDQLMTLGTSVSSSMGMANVVMAQSVGMLMHNAVTTYHNAQISATAATTMGCAGIIESGVVEPPRDTSRILREAAPASPDALMRHATQLVDQAVSMMDDNDPNFDSNRSALTEMLAKLEASTKVVKSRKTKSSAAKRSPRKKASRKKPKA